MDVADQSGKTALMIAAEKGHLEIVSALTSAGANVDVADQVGNTALNLAALQGHQSVVGCLGSLSEVSAHTSEHFGTPMGRVTVLEGQDQSGDLSQSETSSNGPG